MHSTERIARYTYFFSAGACEGDPRRKDLLGGKGAGLAAMCAAGLPVPPGFTIAIPCCRLFHERGGRWPDGLEEEVRAQMARLESVVGRRFGEGTEPLLVSVRSGAAHSMPGMMDTILNCGLHPGLETQGIDPLLFWTVYAQFARQFAVTVAHLAPDDAPEDPPSDAGEDPVAKRRREAEAWMRHFEQRAGRPFPRSPWDALRACINAVFASWNNERARIYRKAHRLEHLQGTAVNVQAMFPSRVSGIAFTANPARPETEEVIVESAYGLGESVVSGDVTPDRFVFARKSGTLELAERHIGHKDHVMRSLDAGAEDGVPFDPNAPSLTDDQAIEVARIALKVEAFFGMPVDIEWGYAHGQFALLQSRAIRGLEIARDVEVGRREEIERLRALLRDEGCSHKVWVVHNLAETLEAPTPLTWDILRAFMSGDGGFGQMYRDLGYRPGARVRREGFLELICGRIYCDPDRAADLFWEGMPYRYDPDAILADPRLLESAPTQFDAHRADEKFLLRLPGLIGAMLRARRRTRRARAEAIERFEKALPSYLEFVRERRAMDLTTLPTVAVLDELEARIVRVMDEFGPESLKPGFFGGCARAELETLLTQLMGPDQGLRLCRTLTAGLEGDSTVEQNILLYQVVRGESRLEEFIERYGHRAVGEMELSAPRWREDDAYVRAMIEAARARPDLRSPQELHRENARARQQAMDRLLETLRAVGGSAFHERVRDLALEAQRLLPFREVGKHYLLLGYELIRLAILELGRRWNLGDDVFFLKRDELARFESAADEWGERIARRKIRWQSARKLDLPDVIDSRDLDRLGLPRPVTASDEIQGLLSLSPGIVIGTARIVFSPEKGDALGDDAILVCPSTDPSWTALFTLIKGLIVERGGVLSHGAIAARDFSIPAVVCPDATRRLRDGARIRVDGDHGVIAILQEPPHA